MSFAGDRSEAGTLTIKQQDGTELAIDVPAVGPNEQIVIDLDATPPMARVVQAPAASGSPSGPASGSWFAEAGGSTGTYEVPQVSGSMGIHTAQGDIIANQSPDEVKLTGPSVAFGYDSGRPGFMPTSQNASYYFWGKDFSGDDTRQASVSSGANQSFALFPSLYMGVTGVLFPVGFDIVSTITNDITYREFGFGTSWECPRFERYTLRPGISVSFGEFNQDISIRDVSTVPGTFAQNNVRIDGNRVTLRAFGRLERPVNYHFSWVGEAGLGIQWFDAKLDSRYNFVCPLCGAPVDNVLILNSDQKKQTSATYDIAGGAEYSTGAWLFYALYQIVRTDTPTAPFPENGNAVLAGETPMVQFRGTTSRRINMGFRFRF